MKFTDKEHMRKFVDLVKSSAGLRAYRSLGLGRAGIQHHLQYLAEYEKVLAEPEKKPESLKVEKKPKVVAKKTVVRKKEVKDVEEGVQPGLRLRDAEGLDEDG